MKNVALLVVLFFAFNALNAVGAPVAIFGLPIGGKLPSYPSVCSEITETKICWISSPEDLGKRGLKYGYLNLPNDSLPSWATYQMMSVTVAGNGTFHSLSMDIKERCDVNEIVRSISARFKSPTRDGLATVRTHNVGKASWDLESISISVSVLSAGRCVVSFHSRESVNEFEKEMGEFKRRESARPKTP